MASKAFSRPGAMGQEYLDLDPLEVMLVGEDGGRRLALGSSVAVDLIAVDPLRARVDLAPAGTVVPRRPRR